MDTLEITVESGLNPAQEEAVKQIIKKGFPYMKFEFEAQTDRDDAAGRQANESFRTFMHDLLSEDARASIVYSKVYYDGSVDTEWTFTIPTESVKYLPQFINAWNKACEEFGSENIDVTGAGFHIAILQQSNYPSNKRMPAVKVNNFKREVTKLLPALLFLASHNYLSRGLSYRKPQISKSDKYSAIYTRNDTIMEFRIFETCWDKPESVFDKVEIIANCLKYYSKRKNKVQFKPMSFFESGHGLERYFETPEKLEVLNASLTYLKPKLKSIEQLKRERNFKLDKRVLDKRFKSKMARYAIEYQEQVDRWEQMAKQEIADFALEARSENGWARRLMRNEEEVIKYLIQHRLIPNKPGAIESYISEREHEHDGYRSYNLMLNPDRR